MTKTFGMIGWLVLFYACGLVAAQSTAPAMAPATTPATQPRHELVMPPGFIRVTLGHRIALCEPADQKWVTAALTAVEPATRPSTMPADLLQRVSAHRQTLKPRMTTDLGLAEGTSVDELFDKKLIPQITKLTEPHVPVFYLATTHARLKQLLIAGWRDPRFYYNRIADDVAIDPSVRFSDEGAMDDMIMPCIYAPDASEDARRKLLAKIVGQNEAAIAEAFSRRAMLNTRLTLIDFIYQRAIEPLKLKSDQQWFGLGACDVLSARYLHDLSGLSYEELMTSLTRDNPRNPIRSASIDLLHPTNPSDLRPQWVPLYAAAFRAKSARVVWDWVNGSGENAIVKTLAACKANPPADGAALLNLIKSTTGADLNDAVKAK